MDLKLTLRQELFTFDEAAAELSISKDILLREANAGRLPVIKFAHASIYIDDDKTQLRPLSEQGIVRRIHIDTLIKIKKQLQGQRKNSSGGETQRADAPGGSPAQDSAPASNENISAADAWKSEAWRLANEIGLMRWGRNEREITGRNICDAVAEKLGKQNKYYGSRGPRAPSSVRNALKGWKFIPPGGTNGTNGTNE